MPVKRRVVKARAELTPGQTAFLRDEDLPSGAAFCDAIQATWLRAEWRDGHGEDMPDGSVSARELWLAYGAEVLASWPMDAPPHWALRRFGPPSDTIS